MQPMIRMLNDKQFYKMKKLAHFMDAINSEMQNLEENSKNGIFWEKLDF